MKKASQAATLALQTIITLCLLGLFILFIFYPEQVKLYFLVLQNLSTKVGVYNIPLIALIAAIESFPVIGLIVPGQQLLLVVGGLYGQTHLYPAILAAGVGACLGNATGYYIGKKWGEQILIKYGPAFSLGKAERDILEPKIQQNGALFIIVGKFHNFTRSFVPLLAGCLNMSGSVFWRYNIIGSLIWGAAMLVIGVFFTRYIDKIVSSMGYIFTVVFVAGGIYIYFFQRENLQKYLDQKSKDLT